MESRCTFRTFRGFEKEKRKSGERERERERGREGEIRRAKGLKTHAMRRVRSDRKASNASNGMKRGLSFRSLSRVAFSPGISIPSRREIALLSARRKNRSKKRGKNRKKWKKSRIVTTGSVAVSACRCNKTEACVTGGGLLCLCAFPVIKINITCAGWLARGFGLIHPTWSTHRLLIRNDIPMANGNR
jgi:hypothetical protein